MRTTLNLEEKLRDEVIKLTGAGSKSEAVNKALEEFVRSDRVRRLLDAPGKYAFDDSWSIWLRSPLGQLRTAGDPDDRGK